MMNLIEQIDLYEKEVENYYVCEKETIKKLRRVLSSANRQPGRPATIGHQDSAADLVSAEVPMLPRNGTKTARVLELLKRPGGATVPQIMAVTKWKAHTVRGFFSGAVKRMGYTLESTRKTPDGKRTYWVRN